MAINSFLDGLNHLTPPFTSPENALLSSTSDFDLSTGVSPHDLQQQLEQWTNVAFNFDESDIAYAQHQHQLSQLQNRDIIISSKNHVDPSLLDPSFNLDNYQNALALVNSNANVDPFGNINLPNPSPSTSSYDNSYDQSQSAADTPADYSEGIPPAKKGGKGRKIPKNIQTDKILAGDKDDELNKVAIEEDKRRRNTAASARFRIKKKQREAALEDSAKILQNKVADLEKEVDALRTENGWLRSLIVEKAKDANRALPTSTSNPAKRKRDDIEVII